MSKLIFRMKYADKKWPEYLTEVFGEEIASKCTIESDATALDYNARIKIDDFKNDQNVIDKLKNNENIISAFIIDNYQAKEVIV